MLNHYRINTNFADQNALQEQPHKTHKVNILEKQFDSVMKNCSALSNVEHKQILSVSLTYVVCLLLQMKTVENHHGKRKAVPVQIRHTLLDAECLSSRVTVNTESMQYKFMMQVLSLLRKLTRKK